VSLTLKRLIELREQGLSYQEISEETGATDWQITKLKPLLPDELRVARKGGKVLGQYRLGGSTRTVASVITREKMIGLREDGWTYAMMGGLYGFMDSSISAFATAYIPDGLRDSADLRTRREELIERVQAFDKEHPSKSAGYRPELVAEKVGCEPETVEWVREEIVRRGREVVRCDRCDMIEEEGNPLAPVKVDGRTEEWCALCRLERAGVNLLEFFESGAAVEAGICI